ncbi:MAG: ABC transporter substrate-binding protein [Rhodobacteraceae bacterium]|nr:ABC transporter substrate-binding protein [Paracoccaceae bacterium]
MVRLYLAASLCVTGLAATAQVLPEHARVHVEMTIVEIDRLVNSDMQRDILHNELADVFWTRSAPKIIARSALGNVWSVASHPQQQEFLHAFINYMAVKYTRYFPRYIGSEFETVYARTTRNDRYFEVKTNVYKQGRSPYPIYWYLTVINNQPHIYNMIVDDLNILALEKNVMQALLKQNNNDLNRLIQILPKRYSEKTKS